MSHLLTTDEAAERLGLSAKTLVNWRSLGGGPQFVKLRGGLVRYRATDLDTFIENSVRSSTSEQPDYATAR